METVKCRPVDLPRTLEHITSGIAPEIKGKIDFHTERALSEGRWKEPEDFLIEMDNMEFMAYWIQKTRKPLMRAMKGKGVEEHLEPFRKNVFDLRPEGFETISRYTMSACGDLMAAIHLEESKDRLYRNVEDVIFDVDLSFANLESTLSEEKKPFKLGEVFINVTPNQYESLIKYRGRQFDVLQLANNHILDCGEEGIQLTIKHLKDDSIQFIGVNESEAQSKQIKSTILGDIKIGWVSHTYSLNDRPYPEGKEWYVDETPFHVVEEPDTALIEKQILQARKEGCDLVFLAMHWGLEHEFYPYYKQLQWAHKFAELGADLLIGHHPHVIQMSEIYKPVNYPGKSVPIIYSLGNLTPIYGSSATVLSSIANIRIEKGMLNGKPVSVLTELKLTPVVFVEENCNGQVTSAIVPLADIEKTVFDDEEQKYFNEVIEYADFVMGRDWRKQ